MLPLTALRGGFLLGLHASSLALRRFPRSSSGLQLPTPRDVLACGPMRRPSPTGPRTRARPFGIRLAFLGFLELHQVDPRLVHFSLWRPGRGAELGVAGKAWKKGKPGEGKENRAVDPRQWEE